MSAPREPTVEAAERPEGRCRCDQRQPREVVRLHLLRSLRHHHRHALLPVGGSFRVPAGEVRDLRVSFVVRPLGALIIGSYGDRTVRRTTLAVVVLLMSGATFLIGVTPGYETIGVIAPIILALARREPHLASLLHRRGCRHLHHHRSHRRRDRPPPAP